MANAQVLWDSNLSITEWIEAGRSTGATQFKGVELDQSLAILTLPVDRISEVGPTHAALVATPHLAFHSQARTLCSMHDASTRPVKRKCSMATHAAFHWWHQMDVAHVFDIKDRRLAGQFQFTEGLVVKQSCKQ